MREVFSCAALSGSQSIPTKYHPHGLELDPAERASEAAPRGGYGRSSSELRDIKTLIKDMKISMTDGDLVGNSRNFVAYAKDIGDSVECLQGSWSLNAPEYAKKPVHEGEKMLTTSSVEESWASVRRRPRSLPGARRSPRQLRKKQLIQRQHARIAAGPRPRRAAARRRRAAAAGAARARAPRPGSAGCEITRLRPAWWKAGHQGLVGTNEESQSPRAHKFLLWVHEILICSVSK